MATMITNECINCGACEPECPNNAISQGETIYIIDPKLCTECVGFHDYEACAAVCPVDCCVTDPNNIETEEALIARARALHPDTQFGDDFASRFRKGQDKTGPAPKKSSAAAPLAAPAAVSSGPAEITDSAVSSYAEPSLNFVELPPIDSWDIPVRCFKCNESQPVPVRAFVIGNVVFCRNCHKSIVVRDNVNFQLRSVLKEFYDRWNKEQSAFETRREQELKEFIEKRSKEARSFETHQRRELETLRKRLEAIGETFDVPGRPLKKGARFGWG